VQPPPKPIRYELTDALIEAIRSRGPEAAGLVMVGLARLVVAVATLMALLLCSSILGIEVTPIPFAAMSGLSAVLSWAITRGGHWR
jgi:hypothetical protein